MKEFKMFGGAERLLFNEEGDYEYKVYFSDKLNTMFNEIHEQLKFE